MNIIKRLIIHLLKLVVFTGISMLVLGLILFLAAIVGDGYSKFNWIKFRTDIVAVWILLFVLGVGVSGMCHVRQICINRNIKR